MTSKRLALATAIIAAAISVAGCGSRSTQGKPTKPKLPPVNPQAVLEQLGLYV